MKIKGLIWFDEIIEKLARKHNVSQNEVREVLENRPHFRFVEKGHWRGENVYTCMGQTKSGRFIIIFFILKKDGRAIVLSARDMMPTERKRYAKT